MIGSTDASTPVSTPPVFAPAPPPAPAVTLADLAAHTSTIAGQVLSVKADVAAIRSLLTTPSKTRQVVSSVVAKVPTGSTAKVVYGGTMGAGAGIVLAPHVATWAAALWALL